MCKLSSGRSRGRRRRAPLQVQILSFRHTNFSKRSRLGSWRPPPPTGNPGSATVKDYNIERFYRKVTIQRTQMCFVQYLAYGIEEPAKGCHLWLLANISKGDLYYWYHIELSSDLKRHRSQKCPLNVWTVLSCWQRNHLNNKTGRAISIHVLGFKFMIVCITGWAKL